MKHDTIILFGLIALSVLTSFFMTFYGINVVMSKGATQNVLVFAYVAIAYGLGSLAVLSIAWSSRERWAVTAIKLFAICFMGVYIMDLVRKGLQVESLASVVVLAVLLTVNWFVVKKVVERE